MSQIPKTTRLTYFLQVISLSIIWVFVSMITWWIIRLITLSLKLHDAPDASVAISIVVIPIFITLAGTLTYVFVGLQRNQTEKETEVKS